MVKGADLVHDDTAWPWCQSLHAPDCRYARLRAKSPTYGQVTLILVDKPREDRFYLFCLASDVPATRLLRVWCVFHGFLPPSPRECCHVIHGNVATQSRGFLPSIPRECCHPLYGMTATLGA